MAHYPRRQILLCSMGMKMNIYILHNLIDNTNLDGSAHIHNPNTLPNILLVIAQCWPSLVFRGQNQEISNERRRERIQLRAGWGMFTSKTGRNKGQAHIHEPEARLKTGLPLKLGVELGANQVWRHVHQKNKEKHNPCSSYEWLCSSGGSAAPHQAGAVMHGPLQLVQRAGGRMDGFSD